MGSSKAMRVVVYCLFSLIFLFAGCAQGEAPPCVPTCEGKLACEDDGCGGDCDPCFDGRPRPPATMGMVCREHADCISGFCLYSEFGPPFCTRPCEVAAQSCPAGDDAEEGEAFCVNYGPETLENLGVRPAPTFQGEIKQFCAKRCDFVQDCEANNPNWETCVQATFLGLPIHPELGSIKICQAPSYHGKEPVDPKTCAYEKTVPNNYMSEKGLCQTYCAYLQTCQVIPADHKMKCCDWGCFNRIYDASIPEVNDAWKDEIKCFIDNHNAYPPIGQANFCSEPPKECDQDPEDPTPPAAEETWWSQ